MAQDSCHILSTEPGISPPSPSRTPYAGPGRIWTPKAGITPQADVMGLAFPFCTLHPGGSHDHGGDGQGTAGGACRGVFLFHSPWAPGFLLLVATWGN